MFCINYTFSESELFELIIDEVTRERVRERLDAHLLATLGYPDGHNKEKHWCVFPLAEIGLLPDLPPFVSNSKEDKVDWFKYLEDCAAVLAVATV
jgi:hypothetical protein